MKFPRIDSPCPLKASDIAGFKNSFCQHCKRTVHDLSAMTDVERVSFMRACDDKVCVTYRVKALGAGVAIAAAIASQPLAAGQFDAPASVQSSPVETVNLDSTSGVAPVPCTNEAQAEHELLDELVIITGGVSHPNAAQWDEFPEGDLPTIPVIDVTDAS